MQKTKRTLKILVAVLLVVVALAIAFAVLNAQKAKQKEREDEDAILHLGELSDPVYLAFNGGGAAEVDEFTLTGDGVWILDSEPEMPLKQDLLENVAAEIPGLTAVRKLSINEELSYYGLDDPTFTLTARDGDGKTLELLVGNVLDENRYYVMEPGGDVLYTIEEELPKAMDRTLFDMVEIDSYETLTDENLLSFEISLGGAEVYFEKETLTGSDGDETYVWQVRADDGLVPAADYSFTDAAGQEVTAQTYIDAILKTFTRSFFFSCKDYSCTDAELSGYGLSDPMKVTVRYLFQNENKEQVESSVAILFGSQFTETNETYGEESYTYAMLEGSKAVNCMTTRRVTPLRDALDALGG